MSSFTLKVQSRHIRGHECIFVYLEVVRNNLVVSTKKVIWSSKHINRLFFPVNNFSESFYDKKYPKYTNRYVEYDYFLFFFLILITAVNNLLIYKLKRKKTNDLLFQVLRMLLASLYIFFILVHVCTNQKFGRFSRADCKWKVSLFFVLSI